MTPALTELLKDSAYKLSQFQPAQITTLTECLRRGLEASAQVTAGQDLQPRFRFRHPDGQSAFRGRHQGNAHPRQI